MVITDPAESGVQRMSRSGGHPWPHPALIPGASRSKYAAHRIRPNAAASINFIM